MTINEAIKHCKDVALHCDNKECAYEHVQLMDWLKELIRDLAAMFAKPKSIGE